MNLIDLHCDTLWRVLDLGGEGDILENDGSVSLRKLEEEGALAQFCLLCLSGRHGRQHAGGAV